MAHRDDPMDTHEQVDDEEEQAMFDEAEAEEIVDEGEDAAMDSDNEEAGDEDDVMQEIVIQNDSVAHFDKHTDSIYCIAQHPTRPEIVATGGGDDIAYVWNITPPAGPLLPTSYESNPQPRERAGQEVLAKLEGHDESVNAICFTLPSGDLVVTGSLAGKLNAYTTPTASTPAHLVGSVKEVEEINWIVPCPNPAHPNTIALGANDGSVWVYTITPADAASSLNIVQSYFLHQGACTAGVWTPDGKLLATVSEDSSLYVWDVFGDAAAAGVGGASSGQALIGLTHSDERFFVEGGLYSVAISPGGGIVAVGGAEGKVRVVGLPRLAAAATKGAAGKTKSAAGQSGQILASLQAQGDGVETLDFSQPPLTLLAAGSVDGSVALFDAAHNFAVRKHLREAHEEEAVIKVEFAKADRPWLLTTAGNDGVVRQWDIRGTSAAGSGLLGEWKGHRGGGEGGGVLGFVQGRDGRRLATAGDDGVALVFDTDKKAT